MPLIQAYDVGGYSVQAVFMPYIANPSSGGSGSTGVTVQYLNKVWDPGGGGNWVSWITATSPDIAGASYPDPYGSGFGACSGFRVITRYG